MTHTCTLPPTTPGGPRMYRCLRCAASYQLVRTYHCTGYGEDWEWFPITSPIPFLCRIHLHRWRLHSYSEGDVCARCDRKKAA